MSDGEGPVPISSDAAAAGVDNPFCTRRVRPGAIPFLFAGDTTAETLVARLRTNDWRGQIVGPHGSGKSALLATLIPAVERAGRQVLLLELHEGQRSLPREFWRGPQLAAATLLIVDGYEQLGRWSRFRLKRFCRRARRRGEFHSPQGDWKSPLHRRAGFQPAQDELETRPTGMGLLVTAHASVGLPELCRTAVNVELACGIAGQLQRGYPPLVTAQEVAERFPRHGGNLRELLFDLYDLYEQRQRVS